jgi:glycine/D-amino acid oxidase-like deaminating enzyme
MAEIIIVGRGLAAACLMHQFHQKGIDFLVVGNTTLSRSSLVAGGIWNPIVFKRLTKSWMADDLIPALKSFYGAIEQAAGQPLMQERHILRAFQEEQEIELWRKKSKNELDDYLDPIIYDRTQAPENLQMTGSFGKVMQAGTLDVAAFLKYTDQRFGKQIHDEQFDYSELKVNENSVQYKNVTAQSIVFCEGWLIKDNPWFTWVPLKPAKGEVLTLRMEALSLKKEISSRASFIFQTPSGAFKSGATYEWNELDEVPTEKAKQELLQRLSDHTQLPYQVIAHEAGVRPASSDRRPILGQHPKHSCLYVFNGLGTKGVMLAPYFSNKFVNFYMQTEDLGREVNLRRFYPLYEEKK